jgi:hypothetical protein
MSAIIPENPLVFTNFTTPLFTKSNLCKSYYSMNLFTQKPLQLLAEKLKWSIIQTFYPEQFSRQFLIVNLIHSSTN